VAEVALAQRVVEEDLLPPPRDLAPQGKRQRDIVLAAEGEHERLEGVELRIRREAEVDAGHAAERLREVLDHGAGREGAQRAVAGRAVARPARARPGRAVHRTAQAERVRHAAQDEPALQVVEAVEVLEDEAELAHHLRLLEVLPERRHELRDEEGVVRGEGGDERRIDREVVVLGMARPAGPAVARERLAEEELAAPLHELLPWVRRRARGDRACDEERGTRERHCGAHLSPPREA
jgi:hypothetical protein